ncbi:MAG: Crp/Fnr family transcriptional regulator [bacterium]|nr:Crp/Fnr family transcriptional regulator [bacterium]
MIVTLLKKVPLFEDLTEAELAALAEVTQIRKFPKNCMVILADDQGDSFFVIVSGKTKVSVTASDGREVILSILGSGEFFGDMSLLDGKPRSANVTTLEESDLLVMRRPDFLQALDCHPAIAVNLMVSLASRLRSADRQTASFALLGITDRICSVLLSLAEEQGVETPDGLVIKKRPTHQVLASMAGTARETITRVLSRLENEGYILSSGRELIILKRDNA